MPAKERHKSTLACARCYQLKKKCDKKVPSCSRCLFARQPCIGINRHKDVEVPRSIVRYLEQLLSESENASTHSSASIARVTDQNRGHNSEVLSPRIEPGSESHYSYIIQAGIASINGQFTTSLLRAQSVLHHNSRLFYGSERPPLKIYVGVHQEEPYRIPVSFSFPDKIKTDPPKVPIGVAKLLLSVYIENVLPRYPCFFETDLQEHFNAVYQDPAVDQKIPLDSSKFIILMVLAISSLTSKAHDFRKVASLSESLHRDALRHSYFLRNADVTSLQCFFLLLQLALLLPGTGNLWYMSGEAMRMAIGLGLHQELREPINFRMADLRRRLFWLAYTFERTVAITSGCPLAISDEHINVNLPSEYEDACLGIEGLDFSQPHRRKKTQFVNHVLFRRLQTKVHVVQFLGHKLTGSATNYDEWVLSLEMEIKIWQDQAFAVNEKAPDWFTNAVRHTQLMLYRPCSRNPIPSHSSIKSALDSAVGICHGSWKLCQTGYLIFPFHNVYNVFQAGLVMLYALQHHSDIVRANFLHSEIMKALSLTPQIFAALAVRWPAAVDTGHYFKELKESILRNLESMPEADNSGESINLLAELDHFVTQRRIRGFNYRNIYPTNVLTISDAISPEWTQVPSVLDESWEEFLNMELNFQNVDSLGLLHGVESENPHNLIPAPSPGPSGRNSYLPSISNLTSVIESLPACNYCRNRRVKCNRSLPSCSTCISYGKQCLYYDAILEQDIERSYAHSLYIKIKSLIAAERDSLPVDNDIDPIPATPIVVSMPTFARNIFLPFPKSTANTAIKETSIMNDFRSLGSIFFGPSSSLAAYDYTLSTSSKYSQAQKTSMNDITVSDPFSEHSIPDQEAEVILPPFSVAAALVNLFMRSVNIFYPTLQLHAMDDMLSKAYNDPEGFLDSFEEQIFYLVLAIASQLTKSHNVGLAFTPSAYFRKGTSGLSSAQERMSKSQLPFLQKSLLICIYLLFSPGSGDIWRSCGFSVRLYFDMIHRPPDDDDLGQPLAIILYRTLYCLECQVAITYGRPTLLSISDTLRDNLMTSVSHTVPEQVSVHFYKSSFIKLQILNDILSTPAASERPTPDIGSRIQAHEEALESWFEEWEKDFQIFTTAESPDPNAFLAPLRAWGDVIYCEILLLLSKLKPPSTEKENLQLCDRFVNACTTLTRHQRNSASLCQISEMDPRIVIDGVPLIFPITWTTTHAVFSATLSLFSEQNQQKRSTADSVARGSTIRRSIMLLAHLEADLNNLTYGFSEIIEQLCISEEMSRG